MVWVYLNEMSRKGSFIKNWKQINGCLRDQEGRNITKYKPIWGNNQIVKLDCGDSNIVYISKNYGILPLQ